MLNCALVRRVEDVPWLADRKRNKDKARRLHFDDDEFSFTTIYGLQLQLLNLAKPQGETGGLIFMCLSTIWMTLSGDLGANAIKRGSADAREEIITMDRCVIKTAFS